jgi:septal ring factor EnvC (AmiA/AmiB activator)
MNGRALALLFLTALAVTPPAAAQPNARSDGRAEELKSIEKRLKDRAEEEKRLKDEAAEREKEVKALRYRMIEAANSLQSSEKRISEIEDDLVRLSKEEATLAASLKAQQGNLGDVLAALQSLELAKPPALLVSPNDANEAARAAMLLSEAAPTLEARASVLRADLQRLVAVRAERDAERQAFEKTRAEIGDRRKVLAELLEKKLAERDVAAALAAAAQKETAALAARATNLRDVIRRLERLASSITPRLKPAAPRLDSPREPTVLSKRPERPTEDAFKPARAFAEARGALKPPVVGRLTGDYGARRPEGGAFEGVRFAAADQAIVTSPYEASIAFARNWGPVGNLIVLDVGGGYHILLVGVSAFLVQEGQKVAAGEPLGLMASADGGDANLDLEIRRNGEPVNPSLWLSKKSIEEMAY